MRAHVGSIIPAEMIKKGLNRGMGDQNQTPGREMDDLLAYLSCHMSSSPFSIIVSLVCILINMILHTHAKACVRACVKGKEGRRQTHLGKLFVRANKSASEF